MHYIYEINPFWMNLIIWENFCFSTTNKQDRVLKYPCCNCMRFNDKITRREPVHWDRDS